MLVLTINAPAYFDAAGAGWRVVVFACAFPFAIKAAACCVNQQSDTNGYANQSVIFFIGLNFNRITFKLHGISKGKSEIELILFI